LLHDLDTRIRAIDSYRYELTRVAGGPEVVIKLRHYQDLSARLRAERHEVYRGILAITERTAHDVMVLDTDWEYTPIQKSEGKYSQYVDGVGLVSSDTPEKLARAVEVVKDDHRTMRALSRGMITRNEARALTEGSISYLIPGEIEANLRLFAKDY
jgi:hypothetical protein